MEEKEVVYSSAEVAIASVGDMYHLGWRVDPNNPPSQIGFNFAVKYIRDPEKAKKSREEILADARAVKAAKKQENK